MTVPSLQTLAQVFTGRLLNTAVEGIALAGLVWVLLRLIGRQNSGTRFVIWFSALLAIVALPFFAGSGFGALRSPALPPGNLHRAITLSGSWAFYLLAAWAVGAGGLLVRLGVGLWRVRHIRKNCAAVDLASLDPTLAAIVRDLGAHRRIKLCVSGGVLAPAAIGFFQPAIVFPAWLWPQLSAEEIKVILLHELAHLRRWDDWTNLAQKIVRAVFFFHPAVWWIENQLTLEREMACDDMVLAQTTSPKAYAASLISFAEKLQNARGLALAQALVSRMRQMSLRVAQILDARRPKRTALWKPVLGVSAGLLALVFSSAPYAPQFVAFQSQPKLSPVQQIQTTKLTPSHDAHPATLAASAVTRMKAEQRAGLAPQLRAIPAAFRSRTPRIPQGMRAAAPRGPAVMRAEAAPKQIPGQETFVIFQTARYDASGSTIWTLCIWRVRPGDSAERQLESAIVLSSI